MGMIGSRARLLDFLEGAKAAVQLKKTDAADRPLMAKGGRKVVIQTGDERIEYAGGFTKVEGRIALDAQDALEPALEALSKTRDEALNAASVTYDASAAAAKVAYHSTMEKLRADREAAVARATSEYDSAARAAILGASSPKG